MKTIPDIDVVASVIKWSKAVFERSEAGGYIHSPYTLGEVFDDDWEDIDDDIYASRFSDEAALLDWLELRLEKIGCGLDRKRLYQALERGDVLDGSIDADGRAIPKAASSPLSIFATPAADRVLAHTSAVARRAAETCGRKEQILAKHQ